MSAVDWPHMLVEQVDFHWSRLLRPRLDGLTDEEYFGEPVPDCWTLRPRLGADGRALGGFAMDAGDVVGPLPPFTTIAWRLAHVTVDVLSARTHRVFDGPTADRTSYRYAGTASDALAQLDAAYLRWKDGVSRLTSSRLGDPCGPEEPYFRGEPLAVLILHVNREMLCHCAEIALLRDLYARRPPASPSPGRGRAASAH